MAIHTTPNLVLVNVDTEAHVQLVLDQVQHALTQFDYTDDGVLKIAARISHPGTEHAYLHLYVWLRHMPSYLHVHGLANDRRPMALHKGHLSELHTKDDRGNLDPKWFDIFEAKS